MKCSERRQGNTTQQKDKATQHNTTRPRQLFSKKKTAPGVITIYMYMYMYIVITLMNLH